MGKLTACADAIDLSELSRQVKASSNFNFAWQFYRSERFDLSNATDIRRALQLILSEPDLHGFLKETFKCYAGGKFSIEPLHVHAWFESVNMNFEDTLAQIAGDHAGAYSNLRGPMPHERQRIVELFSQPASSYFAFQLRPGTERSCGTCKEYNNEIFSTWFFGVAWDWCYLVGWPELNLLWIGCLTDTD